MSLTCWFHGHATYVQRNKQNVLELVCDVCGYRTEAIKRTPKERRVMRKKFKPAVESKAAPAEPNRIVRFK